MTRALSHCASLALFITANAAVAQFPKIPGSVSSLAGAALPNIASIGAGNAAGVLGYCVKNNVLNGGSAESVLGQLTGQSGVKTSPGYADGQKGLLKMTGSSLSLKSLTGEAKTKACKAVLKQARSFL